MAIRKLIQFFARNWLLAPIRINVGTGVDCFIVAKITDEFGHEHRQHDKDFKSRYRRRP